MSLNIYGREGIMTLSKRIVLEKQSYELRRNKEMMKKKVAIVLAATMMMSLAGCAGNAEKKEEAKSPAVEKEVEEKEENVQLEGALAIYCGAGMQKPFQEIADAFQDETGCEMNVTYANAAQIQTQIQESQEGDFFIAGSKEELKPVEEFVTSSEDLVKHIPVLVVREGNEKNIQGLNDLTREDVVTVIGDPESTPIGKIAKKAFADFQIGDKVNIAATTTTAPQLATVVGLGEADAAIIWKENAKAEGVELCNTTDLDDYVKVIPAARLSFNENVEAADAFVEFLGSEEAHAIWESFGYELVK